VHWAKEWARGSRSRRSRSTGTATPTAASASSITIAAIASGADRVHACALGIGERVGNTPMDQLLVNLKLMGWIDNDLSALPDYTRVVSESCEVPIPVNYPVVGRDAFRTARASTPRR
jgi:isopropylmalate/homocitrate/citramalate synthase